jgi:multisubunit Na+/H+ antiporter MnhB subunit
MLWVLVIVSLVLYGIGHNYPGGGFVGGVLAVIVFVLFCMVRGVPQHVEEWTRRMYTVGVMGVCIAFGTGAVALLFGYPFLTHTLISLGIIKLPSAVFFDTGVYLSVGGSLSGLILTIEQWRSHE